MMMKKLKHIITSTLLLFAVSVSLIGAASPALVSAQVAKDEVCKGLGLTTGTTGCDADPKTGTVDSTVGKVINVLSFVVGVISVIMVIIGGLKYVTSGGDSSKVSSAKDTILYAIVGLVVVAMSQVIVRFVLKQI